jgi:hypothetical protein
VAAVALARNAWESDWGGIRTALTAFWTTTAAPILGQLMTWLQVNVPAALQFLTNAWNNTLLPALRAVWGFLSTSIIPLWQALAGVEMALLQKALEALAGIWQNILLPALQSVWQFITKNITPMFDGLGAAIDPITDKISDLIGWVDSLRNSLSGLKLPEWMTPGSPTPLELGLVGINDAMKQLSQSAGAVRIPQNGGSSNTFNIAVSGGRDQTATLAAIEAGVDRALARSGQRGMSTNELAWALARAMQQQRAGRSELS